MSIPAALRAQLLRQLAARRAELRAQLAGAGLPHDDLAEEVHDQKAMADDEARHAVEDVALAHAHQELALVTAALRRLEEGSYGTCQDCGGPIGESRLLALPEAGRCAACQRESETRRVAAG